MAREPRRQAGSGHRMPVVAHAAGVENERIGGAGGVARRARRDRQEPGATIPGEEPAVGEQARRSLRVGRRRGPLHRREPIVVRVRKCAQRRNVEIARAPVLEAGQRGVFAEDVGRRGVVEAGKAHPARDIADDAPVVARLAGRRQEGALARYAPLRIGDRSALFAPGGRRQQHMGGRGRVGSGDAVGDDDERAGGERGARAVGVGQADERVGRHDPDRLDPAVGDRLEHLDRFQALPLGDDRRAPEALHQRAMRGILDLHMGRELVGETADLAPAHRVGLPGQGEGAHPGASDPPGQEMAVEDRIDLVDAARRLVDPLRIEGDHLRVFANQSKNSCDPALGKSADFGGAFGALAPRGGERLGGAVGMRGDEGLVRRRPSSGDGRAGR